jgi:hypothetical protein
VAAAPEKILIDRPVVELLPTVDAGAQVAPTDALPLADAGLVALVEPVLVDAGAVAKSVEPGTHDNRVRVPYEAKEGLASRIIVEATLNRVHWAKLAIDTGAPHTILSTIGGIGGVTTST